MNPNFLNNLTEHRSRWDSVLLAEHIGLIRGYRLVANQDCFNRTSRAWARDQLADCLDNFAFYEEEKTAYARRYK